MRPRQCLRTDWNVRRPYFVIRLRLLDFLWPGGRFHDANAAPGAQPAKAVPVLGISVGARNFRDGSNCADNYDVVCAARAIIYRPRTDFVRSVFLSQLAEKGFQHSVTRRQVSTPATRARTKPATEGVSLSRFPA